ncbi:MAG: 23S rRNA (adenine(2503)-C(2))-methyltransferase RlmN [Elusimicrobiaceae bacterium]|nr:23S rRNA (adenine(2503)-C(2))-methyltransferase RlmN [Elusimicrobiaceae bacterium]
MKFEQLKKYLKEQGYPGYRTAQVREAVFERMISGWDEAGVLPEKLRRDLAKNFPILSFAAKKVLSSAEGNAHKALLVLADKVKIETVLMNTFKNNWSVCVSTQVGCPVRCSFCATGKRGFKRNLHAEEITDQVLFWNQYVVKHGIAERISSVVFMGMGEPLLNYAATVKAVRDLSDPDYLNIGHRHISVSTSGHAEKIRAFALELPQVNLAVSLHTAIDAERDELVPINRRYNLAALRDALQYYLAKTGRQLFIEYTVIGGVNDTHKHIRLLNEWIKAIPNHYLIHINLIACNPADGTEPSPAARAGLDDFAAALTGCGLSVSVRRSLGGDIAGACGQLAGR